MFDQVGAWYNNGLKTILRIHGGFISGFAHGVTTFINGTLLDNVAFNNNRVRDISFTGYADGRTAAFGNGLAVLRGYGDGNSYVLRYNSTTLGAVSLPGGIHSDGNGYLEAGPGYL
jgi:hypothetical protein